MQGRERVIASSRHSIRVSPPDAVALYSLQSVQQLIRK